MSFVGLPLFVSNTVAGAALALPIVHAITEAPFLASRENMPAEARAYEGLVRAAGLGPGELGHRVIVLLDEPDHDAGAAYPDGLVRFLKYVRCGGLGGVPPAGAARRSCWSTDGSAPRAGVEMRCGSGSVGGVETEEE